MKSNIINLYAFSKARIDTDIFKSYKKINHLDSLRDDELSCIDSFYDELIQYVSPSNSKLSGYQLGKSYKGAVSEEFDILRFSEGKILNIELKSSEISPNKLLRQLKRHSYLLKSINVDFKVSLYTFVKTTKALYKFENDTIMQVDFRHLVEDIPSSYIEENLLETLDDTSFIISPYSEPDRFFNSQYFLNTEQEEATKRILTTNKHVVALKGGAGTGKSLILFEVAKQFCEHQSKKVLFIFCSALNTHTQINSKTQFSFMDITEANKQDDDFFKTFDIVIIDESQRLRECQFKRFLTLTRENKIILSVDKAQTLKKTENNLDVESILNRHKDGKVEFIDCLTQKVRTDISISTFIQKLFNKQERDLTVMSFPKVNAIYFNTPEEAKVLVKNCIESEKFVLIEMPEYTGSYKAKLPKMFDSLDGFKVIGREFDKVLVPLSPRVKYNSDNKLVVSVESDYPYLAINGLFQALTRVKQELLIIVIGSKSLYKEIEEILTWKEFREYQNISKRLKALREVNGYTEEEIAQNISLSINEYVEIENSGKIPNKKTKKSLAKIYNVDSQYIDGEPSELNYSKLDIIYKNKIKSLNGEQKQELEHQIINFINDFDC